MFHQLGIAAWLLLRILLVLLGTVLFVFGLHETVGITMAIAKDRHVPWMEREAFVGLCWLAYGLLLICEPKLLCRRPRFYWTLCAMVLALCVMVVCLAIRRGGVWLPPLVVVTPAAVVVAMVRAEAKGLVRAVQVGAKGRGE